MRRVPLVTALLLGLAVSFQAAATATIPEAALRQAEALRAQALNDDTAWKVTASLTTEVGPRLAGSEADARAVAWAQAKFKALGFDKVWTEPVTFPKWERRSEHAEIVGEHAQSLVVTALGGSPGGTVEAEVVRFPDLAALQAVPDGSLTGKIVFVDYQMQKQLDGGDYHNGGGIRARGPSVAIGKGAAAFVMRSAGTTSHRLVNTGMTRYAAGLTPVPAAALSIPDANQLARLLKLGPVKLHLSLDCGWDGQATSYNVIGEITGRSEPEEIVLTGGHLDSWDLGTGAIDDAAGIGISMAAAHLLGRLPQRPARTIRVVAFANEEQGLLGGAAYAQAHAKEIKRHVIAVESDFGAGRIYGFDSNADRRADQAITSIAAALKPLDIAYLPGKGEPESDINPISKLGVRWAWLGHDGTDYFDLHHNADDTLDKIDPKALAQNVAAYAVFLYLAAETQGDFGSTPKTEAPTTP